MAEDKLPPSMPADPVSVIVAKAVEMNEIYKAYIAAGFERQEAMQIVMWKLAMEIQGGGDG